jgi:predicted PurR-regulated permease PerM
MIKRFAWRFAAYTAIVLAALITLVLAWKVREPLLLFLMSLAIAAAFRPPIDALCRRGWRRGPALAVTYLLALLVIGGLIYLIGGPLARDLSDASNYLARAYERAMARWPNSPLQFQRTLASQLPPPPMLYRLLAGPQGTVIIQNLLGAATNFASVLSNVSMVLVLSVYWNADSVRFERLWLSLLPVSRRLRARDAWHDIESQVGAYIRGEALAILVAGVLLWAGYALLDVPYPVLLAIFGALARLVPWVGVPLALIPAYLVGSISSPELGIVAAVLTLVVLVMVEKGLRERFFPRREYSYLLIGTFVIALAFQFGLGGAIMAPILAVAVQVIGGHLLAAWNDGREQTPEAVAAPLKERLGEVRARLAQDGEAATPEIQSLLDRLDSLVTASQEYIER